MYLLLYIILASVFKVITFYSLFLLFWTDGIIQQQSVPSKEIVQISYSWTRWRATPTSHRTSKNGRSICKQQTPNLPPWKTETESLEKTDVSNHHCFQFQCLGLGKKMDVMWLAICQFLPCGDVARKTLGFWILGIFRCIFRLFGLWFCYSFWTFCGPYSVHHCSLNLFDHFEWVVSGSFYTILWICTFLMSSTH